jgi:hypothetical protein
VRVANAENAYAHWQSGPPVDYEWLWLTYGLGLVTIGVNAVVLSALNFGILRFANKRRRSANQRDPLLAD